MPKGLQSIRITNYLFWTVTIINCLVLSSSAPLTTSQTHISTTRNADRATICGYYSAQYSSEDIASSNSYISQYSYLSTAEIESILYNGNFVPTKTETILIMAPHFIIFSVFAILWIPLCCCCVWPEKHPTCPKFRKPEKQMYTKLQLKWPAYCTIVFYLVTMVGGILGIIKGVDIVYSFNDVGCKTAAVADDTMYGRLSPTVQNRFFVGLEPFKTDLTSFNSTFNTIWTQNDNALQNAGNIATQQNLFELGIANSYATYSNPVYSTAFSSDGINYVDVNSEFKNLFYGPLTNSTTILGTINSINAVLDPMKAAHANLSATTESTVQSQMTSTVTGISSFSTQLTNFIGNWNKFFSNQSSLDQFVLLLKAFYGLFFALSILGLLGSIILACFSVVKVRLIMYFACSFLFFFGFISFVLLIILAALAPTLSQTCAYLDSKISTGAGTADLFTRLGFSTMGNFFSNCMSDGTGWMMNDLNPTFNTTFSDLILITKNIQLFNLVIPNYSTANLTAPFTSGLSTVNKVSNAQLLDVNDTIALNHITAVRLVSYPIDIACTTLNVQGDSWMPSYDLYSCPGGKASNTPCGDLSSTGTCPLGCYEILKQFQSAAGDNTFETTLASRYGSNTCNYFNYVVNLQKNWNIPRQSSMSSVNTSLNSDQTNINNYDTAFKATQANISTYQTILQSTYNGLTNLTAGTFYGLDCRVLGQSITDMRNSICVGMLNSVYHNLICLILISYGTLMAACCTVCAGVRHFKHLQRMIVHVGYKGVPVMISDKSRILEKG